MDLNCAPNNQIIPKEFHEEIEDQGEKPVEKKTAV